MSIIENYRTNHAMRARYFRMNGITHAEICDATDCCDHDDQDAYKIMLTDGNGVGFWEPREFSTVGQARKWCADFAPELTVV